MPTYDYRCDHCGHEFSKVQSFTEGAVEKCPRCGERPTRLMSLPSIVFKGSGWYKTDSRSTRGSSDGAAAATKGDKDEKTGKAETTDKPEKSKTEKSGSGEKPSSPAKTDTSTGGA